MAAGGMIDQAAMARALVAPANVTPLFVTEVYRTDLGGTPLAPLLARVDAACRSLAAEDRAGQRWARDNGYLGYTSFDSFDNLHDHAPVFGELRDILDVHVFVYMQLLEMDLRGKRPVMQRSWVNTLQPGGAHSGHIHPHSTISGTIYLSVPQGSGALEFEDPRLPRMMHAPLRRPDARPDRRTMVAMAPQVGTLMLWESWLQHAVATNRASEERISISFNYDL